MRRQVDNICIWPGNNWIKILQSCCQFLHFNFVFTVWNFIQNKYYLNLIGDDNTFQFLLDILCGVDSYTTATSFRSLACHLRGSIYVWICRQVLTFEAVLKEITYSESNRLLQYVEGILYLWFKMLMLFLYNFRSHIYQLYHYTPLKIYCNLKVPILSFDLK